MKTLAAVLVETQKPLVLTDIEIPVLKPGQVLVEILFSGVCHTQLLETRGHRGEDKFLPHCLGHEGSGVVRDLGSGVKKVKAGDRVILSWMKGSGADVPGTVYDWNGKKVNAGAITTFSRHAVISENRLTVIDDALSSKEAALIGCAVPTGMGSVLNTAGAKAGMSCAVFGLGGVGLCAVAAASAAGCSPVIAVDINKAKWDVAKKMGATQVIDAANDDVTVEILKLVPKGLDIAIEATGQPSVMKQAFYSVRPQGGAAVIVGNARHGATLDLDPRQFNMGKKLLGTWGGDNNPDRDFPLYVGLVKSKKVNLDLFTRNVYKLEQINRALDDLEKGAAVRPLVDMSI